MLKKSIVFAMTVLGVSCGQSGSSTSSKTSNLQTILSKDQKMDTAHFWNIMDYAFKIGGLDNSVREKAILEQMIKLTPDQIQQFEIIFQQMNRQCSTWENFAAATTIMGGSTDDGFYYFRCWLISLGQQNYYATLKNADHLAIFDIPEYQGLPNAEFEELISMSDRAYEIVTKKDPSSDTTFPRYNASRLGLFYDTNVSITGKEWQSEEELPGIVPKLYKKYADN